MPRCGTWHTATALQDISANHPIGQRHSAIRCDAVVYAGSDLLHRWHCWLELRFLNRWRHSGSDLDPSFSIGLGYLVDDGLWIYGEVGTITQKVTDKLRGHPQFDSSDRDRRRCYHVPAGRPVTVSSGLWQQHRPEAIGIIDVEASWM